MKKRKYKKTKKINKIDFLNSISETNENKGNIQKTSYVSLIKFSYKMDKLMRKYDIELDDRKNLSKELIIIIRNIYNELIL